MDSRYLTISLLIWIVLISGCIGDETKTRYVCPDGSIVSDADICFKEDLKSRSMRNDCSSVSNILDNRDYCDLKQIDIVGRAKSIEFKTSKKGGAYTIFHLADTKEQIKVFVWKHPSIHEGDKVRVKGIFYKIKQVGEYSFYDEIDATAVELINE